MKNMMGTDGNAKATADNKIQHSIMYVEGVLTKCFPGVKTYFIKVKFGP